MDVECTSRKRRLDDSGILEAEGDLRESLAALGWPRDGLGSCYHSEDVGRCLQTTLTLSQDVLIHCPPLSPIRPHPSLLVRILRPAHSAGSSKRKHNQETKSYPLPLPVPLTSAPYTYGRPTLLSRSCDSNQLLVFWPRLSNKIASGLSQLASAAIATTTKSSSTLPDPSSGLNFYQDEAPTIEQGGILTLYTRPAPSTRRTTYFYTFDIHSYWNTDYNPITSLWLFEQRKWEVRPVRNKLNIESDTADMHVDQDEAVRGQIDESLPNGLPNGHAKEEPSNKAPVEFSRTPFRGPRSSSTGTCKSSSNPSLGFLVLFADHHLNFYTAEKSLPPVNVATETFSESHPAARYPKLDVLSCPLLTPSTVFPQPPPLNETNYLVPASTWKSRLIVPGQATLHVRAGDETVWVAFRSYRPRSIWMIGDDVDGNPEVLNGSNTRLFPAVNGMLPDSLDPTMLPSGHSIGHRIQSPSKSAFRGGDAQGVEEHWLNVVEVQLELKEDVLSMSARPIPRLELLDTEEEFLYNSGYRLNGIVFSEKSEAVTNGDPPAETEEHETRSQTIDPERPLSLVVALSPLQGQSAVTRLKTKLVKYEIGKRNVVLSDAFAKLGSPTLPARNIDLSGTGRAEWIPRMIQVEEVSGNVKLVQAHGCLTGHTVLAAIEEQDVYLGEVRTRLAWLSLQNLKLGPIVANLDARFSEVWADSWRDMIIWRMTGSFKTWLEPLTELLDPASPHVLEDLVNEICGAILNGETCPGPVSKLIRLGKDRRDNIDSVLLVVWTRLCQLADGVTPAIIHVTGFVQIQHTILSAAQDERSRSAFFMLQCLRSLQLFTLAYRSAGSHGGEEGSKQRQHTYETGSFWLLLSHTKWYLGMARAIVRSAIIASSKTAPGPDHFIALQFVINPVSRAILRDLHNHAQAFTLYAARCTQPLPTHPALSRHGQVDFKSTTILQAELRQSLDSAGVKLGYFSNLYDFCAENTRSDIPDLSLQEWSTALYLDYALPDTADSSISRILAYLTTDDKIIQHQACLFIHDVAATEVDSIETDIITKETLPASTCLAQEQNRTIRRCAKCDSRTASWLSPLSSDGVAPQGVMPAIIETNDSTSKWLNQWQHTCICGGQWQPL